MRRLLLLPGTQALGEAALCSCLTLQSHTLKTSHSRQAPICSICMQAMHAACYHACKPGVPSSPSFPTPLKSVRNCNTHAQKQACVHANQVRPATPAPLCMQTSSNPVSLCMQTKYALQSQRPFAYEAVTLKDVTLPKPLNPENPDSITSFLEAKVCSCARPSGCSAPLNICVAHGEKPAPVLSCCACFLLWSC